MITQKIWAMHQWKLGFSGQQQQCSSPIRVIKFFFQKSKLATQKCSAWHGKQESINNFHQNTTTFMNRAKENPTSRLLKNKNSQKSKSNTQT
jgi:hypothetical protein